jgi:hypothetical protein
VNIDLFCRVIDNYGDIGVCWRLARQLVAEHDCFVRLIVDDPVALKWMAGGYDDRLAYQFCESVMVMKWSMVEGIESRSDGFRDGHVVIEAFACNPPEAYVRAMAASAVKPLWINLEYLTAEAWIDDVHGLPSPHPRLPLTKYFFCPGFTEKSGGLIREEALIFEFSPSIPSPGGGGLGCGKFASATTVDDAQATIPHPSPPPLGKGVRHIRKSVRPRLFAFCYSHAPLRALASALDADVTTASPTDDPDPNWRRAHPVTQTEFDAVLAPFDIVIVRGEDSFLRAQFAAKPLIWHIYPTPDDAHLIKLDAWLDRYCHGLNADTATAYRAASHAFNWGESDAGAYQALVTHLPALAAHARAWRTALFAQDDLATRLLRFIALQQNATKP